RHGYGSADPPFPGTLPACRGGRGPRGQVPAGLRSAARLPSEIRPAILALPRDPGAGGFVLHGSGSPAGEAMIPGNLIINADDFGLDERISRAISRCLDEGLINSFSVFPFADAFHDRLLREIIARHPAAKVGVHLSLIGPTAGAPQDVTFGEFREHAGHFRDFLALYLTGRYPASRVRGEWRRQIEFVGGYLGGAGRVSHLDSHQH